MQMWRDSASLPPRRLVESSLRVALVVPSDLVRIPSRLSFISTELTFIAAKALELFLNPEEEYKNLKSSSASQSGSEPSGMRPSLFSCLTLVDEHQEQSESKSLEKTPRQSPSNRESDRLRKPSSKKPPRGAPKRPLPKLNQLVTITEQTQPLMTSPSVGHPAIQATKINVPKHLNGEDFTIEAAYICPVIGCGRVYRFAHHFSTWPHSVLDEKATLKFTL